MKESRALDARLRRALPGAFIELSEGFVHYEIAGPAAGEPVVLVPGLSVPYSTWDPIVPYLSRAGYRSLRYDHYGRGFSDRPRVRYDLELFIETCLPQMEYLGFRRAILSTLRTIPSWSLVPAYERVGRRDASMLVVWGRHDRTLPSGTYDGLRRRLPGADFRIIEEAGHVPHYDAPQEFNGILMEFLEHGQRVRSVTLDARKCAHYPGP